MRVGIERAELRERVCGLGSRRRLLRRALEILAALRVVDAETEEARDRLRAEHVGRLEPGVARGEPDRPRGREEPRRRDELGVELAHRHEAGRVGRRLVGLPEGDDRSVQLRPRERVVGPEGRDVGAHHARKDDRCDLRSPPSSSPGPAQASGHRPADRTPAPPPAVRAPRAPRQAAEPVSIHPSPSLSDGCGARLIDGSGMCTESVHSNARPRVGHPPGAVERHRGARDDPRLGPGGRAGRAGGAVDDALLLRRASRGRRRGRAQRRRPPSGAASRGGRRPTAAARPVRARGHVARRGPGHRRATRTAPSSGSGLSSARCRGSAVRASRWRCSCRTPTSRGRPTRRHSSRRRWRTRELPAGLAQVVRAPLLSSSAGEPGDQLERAAGDAARVGRMGDVPAEQACNHLEDARRAGGREHGARVAIEGALRRPRRGGVAVERRRERRSCSPRDRPRGSRRPRAGPRRTPRTCRRRRAGRRVRQRPRRAGPGRPRRACRACASGSRCPRRSVSDSEARPCARASRARWSRSLGPSLPQPPTPRFAWSPFGNTQP